VNGKISVNVAGIGFDAHVASRFGKGGKRGLAEYARLVLQEFGSYREFGCEALIDGKSYKSDAFIIALANSSQFGNNALVAPDASVCDGLIEVCFIKKIPVFAMPAFATRMFTGKIGTSRFVDIVKASRFEVEFKKPLPYHIDGESFEPTSRFVVEIQPGALKMIVPVNPGKVL
jgi:diacylglycerol kinase family enzyme